MRAVVVGAGPVGLYCAVALARMGHDVHVVDRDPGPPPSGAWERRGVMQFMHPHFFRPIVREALLDRMPDVWDVLVEAGGITARPPGAPESMTALECRRSTYERAVRAHAGREPHVTVHTGHADRVLVERDRVTGVVVDGSRVVADLVLCATGRATRFADAFRGPAEGGPSGFSYVSRMYRARAAGSVPTSAFPMGAFARGYLTIVFPQDDRTLSALIVRASTDEALSELRRTDCFEAAARAIPNLARWTGPDEFEPITAALPGGGLTNTYQGQDGAAPAGLVFVGDSVCTTNPAAGRGVSLGLRQARALMGMLDAGEDARDVAAGFDAWCTTNVKPWYEDHVYWDATLLARWDGADIDVEARLPSDVICAAADVDQQIAAAALPFLGMQALPSVLTPMEARARAVLRTGWRPPLASGPTRDELADLVLAAARPAAWPGVGAGDGNRTRTVSLGS